MMKWQAISRVKDSRSKKGGKRSVKNDEDEKKKKESEMQKKVELLFSFVGAYFAGQKRWRKWEEKRNEFKAFSSSSE